MTRYVHFGQYGAVHGLGSRAMTLARYSTILGQEFEMVPGFLIPHWSCAGTVTALQQ